MADMELQQEKVQQNIILSPREFDLLERIIRVEQELKDLKEAMDKRFTLIQWTVMLGFTLLGVMISVYKFIP